MLRLVDSGDEAVTIYLTESASADGLALITSAIELIRRELGEWVTDIVPSYCTATVYYDLLYCSADTIHARLLQLLEPLVESPELFTAEQAHQGRSVELPVYYGTEVAPDLKHLAEFAGHSVDEVIQLHCGSEYRVFALGFRPGFAFLGTTPPELQMPRLDSPRARVPTGSVAIAGAQAAVYPGESPGGWNLIGRCPTILFDRQSEPPRVLLNVGDRVRFTPINRAQFLELGGVLDD